MLKDLERRPSGNMQEWVYEEVHASREDLEGDLDLGSKLKSKRGK